MTMRAMVVLACIVVSAGCSPSASSVGSESTAPGASVIESTRDGVLLTSAQVVDRPCETLAIIDLHSQASDESAAFEELRGWARTLRGHAVVAARFEPAVAGEPAHLSGIVVRFKTADARPYDVLAEVEVRTESDGPNKGLDALREKARELGADKVVDVRFDHDEGGVSRLRGLAVRYRRS